MSTTAPQTRTAPVTRRRSPRRTTVIILVCVLALVAGAAVLGLLQPRTNEVPLSVHNPQPDGTRAVAQILGERGIDVQEVTTTSAAIADARPDGTLVITDADRLRPQQLTALADLQADIVLLSVGFGDLGHLTDRFGVEGGGTEDTYQASCSASAARAAGTIHTAGPGLAPRGDITTCFPLAGGTYAFGTWRTPAGQWWAVLPNPHPATNAGLAQQGNAALSIRILGRTDHVTWYVPDPSDDFGQANSAPTALVPVMVAVQILILLIVIALWRGRRLGPVVTEPLPVVVRATETTRGRGRLYRRGKAHAHSGAALRAGALSRLAPRIGLPRSATREDVIAALAHATGREPEAIADLLYGPSPTDDTALMRLAQALDQLEEEVSHR